MPAFLPAVARVGYRADKPFSSNFPLSNILGYGFTVGLAVQPGDADGNADFGELSNCEFSFGAFQLSIGNTQARNNNAYRLTGQTFHTAVTTTKHGRQSGKLGGIFLNCSWGACNQLIDLGDTSVVGPHTFKQCYAEAVQRIGDTFAAGGAAGAPILFEACQFEFSHDIAPGQRGVPLALLGINGAAGVGTMASGYRFADCVFSAYKGALTLLTNGVRLDNCSVREAAFTDFASQWRARALNTLAGGLVVPGLSQPVEQLIRYTAGDETGLTAGVQASTIRANRTSSRDQPASIYTPTLCPASGKSREEFVNPASVAMLGKSDVSGLALSGRTLSFTLTGGSTLLARLYQLWPGAVMLDADSGMIFFVKTVSAGFACTAELQNGYGYSPSGAVRIDKAFDPAGRYFFIAGGGVFTPNYPLFADLSSTSAILTNCQRADGYGGFVNAGATSVVQAGDFPVTDEYTLQPFVIGHGVVAVGAGTISMASPPVVTAAKTRLALWVRGS
jgi:hypothetical protein